MISYIIIGGSNPERIEILYSDFKSLQDKLKRRNCQIADLKTRLKELKRKLGLCEPTEQEYKDFKRCDD